MFADVYRSEPEADQSDWLEMDHNGCTDRTDRFRYNARPVHLLLYVEQVISLFFSLFRFAD